MLATSKSSCYVRSFQSAIVTRPMGLLSGARTYKLPLTHTQKPFAVRHRLQQESLASGIRASARSRLSWLSYSPSCFSQERRASPCPTRTPRGAPDSPRQPKLNEPDFTDPNPSGGFSPASHQCGPPRGGCFSVAPTPCPRAQWASDRTPGLLSFAERRRITPMSLRRTGQATLVASGSTSKTLLLGVTQQSLARLVRPCLPGRLPIQRLRAGETASSMPASTITRFGPGRQKSLKLPCL